MKKLLRIALLGFAILATLVVLFYAWTDWAGARHWKAVEASLRAKGEPVAIAEIEPPPIPDELNFAGAPIFAELYRIADEKKQRLSSVHGFTGAFQPNSSALANAARAIDPVFRGSDHDAAEIILSQTAKWRPVLDEVREAATRPQTEWPSDYSAGFRMRMPHLSPLLRLAQIFSAESQAYLELNNSSAALADFQLILNLASRCERPTNVISYLVRQSIISRAIEAIRFGIDRQAWPSTALDAIQQSLSGISLPPKLAEGYRSERVFFIDSLSRISAEDLYKSLKLSEAQGSGNEPSKFALAIWSLRPAGWIREDQVAHANAVQPVIEWLERGPPFRPEKTSSPEKIFEKIKKTAFSSLRTPLAITAVSSILRMVQPAIFMQATVDEAQIACAIERYRLIKGTLPATLALLKPNFISELPADPITGDPFRYRLIGPGHYLLYSVGWNEVDDGGSAQKPAHSAQGKAEDWVWGAKP